jgi:peptidoglycan L-alanyl-D-glutamate endopeptidase CwlK
MPKFSQSSFSKLSTCHHDLQVLFFEVIKYFDCTIVEGYRNQEDQEKAFAAGNTKLHYPYGKHNHQPSMAVDVMPYPINYDDTKLLLFFGGYVLGLAQRLKEEGKMEHSVRWGGSWDGLGKLNRSGQLNDTGHFELIE